MVNGPQELKHSTWITSFTTGKEDETPWLKSLGYSRKEKVLIYEIDFLL